ncbi:MAG: LCP family protein [Oscillospiraceae bacterium]|nr:LCP family protein [Oscillospiraceae bacterium]
MTNQPNDNGAQSELSSEQNVAPKAKKMKKSKKVLLIIFIVFLSLIVVGCSSVAILWFSGRGSLLTDKDDVEIIKPQENVEAEIYDDNTVFYKDSVYSFNENITTILCMGIDEENTSVIGHSGQSDAIFLLAIDTETGKSTVIGIPRDSMVDVDMYSSSGSFIGVEKTQVCLAFAYGDGKDGSCKNVARSVSRLLCGMPINSYFAMDFSAVETLHRAVGLIKVRMNEDLALPDNKNGVLNYYKKGDIVSLYPNQALSYLYTRNQTTTNAAYLRMERQLEYLKKYSAAAINKTKSDITFPVKLYNKVLSNSITDINAAKVTYLTSAVVGSRQNVSLEFKQLRGEYKKGNDGFAELYIDETEVFELVLSIFYEKIK